MAFAIIDADTGEVKNSEKYVKWIGSLVDIVDGKESRSEVPIYECSEADFIKFHAPTKASAKAVSKYKLLDKKNGGFMCIDWKDIKLSR